MEGGGGDGGKEGGRGHRGAKRRWGRGLEKQRTGKGDGVRWRRLSPTPSVFA